MVSRKQRVRVVLDTNVFVRALRSLDPESPNQKVLRLWLQKRLQLIVSNELVNEYLGVFAKVLELTPATIDRWGARFQTDPRSTLVNLGRRFSESRDPDDNMVLATAAVGRVEFLLTNDRDLLDLPSDFKRSLRFRIQTPAEFLEYIHP
jgi:putative PIN family toxin of toxin-antitoxin system